MTSPNITRLLGDMLVRVQYDREAGKAPIDRLYLLSGQCMPLTDGHYQEQVRLPQVIDGAEPVITVEKVFLRD